MTKKWEILGLKAAPGETAQGMVKLPSVAKEIPLVLIHGAKEGPTTVILGGIHGCEYTSIDAAIKLSQLLKKEAVRGRIAVIPVVSVEAYSARSIYVHPVDKKNLNRNFPGNEKGTETERLAFQVHQAVMKDCDFLIDLHGGDMNEALIPFILFAKIPDKALYDKSHQFAKAFGLPYVVGSATEGSTYGCAAKEGKVAVLAEAGQQGIMDPEKSKMLVDGTLNALRSIDVLTGKVVEFHDQVDVEEFVWTRSAHFGTWYPMVSVGQEVKTGQKAGELRDLLGNTLQEIHTQVSGPVLFAVTTLAINNGDPLFAVGVIKKAKGAKH